MSRVIYYLKTHLLAGIVEYGGICVDYNIISRYYVPGARHGSEGIVETQP